MSNVKTYDPSRFIPGQYEKDLSILIQSVCHCEKSLDDTRSSLFEIENFTIEKAFHLCANSDLEIITRQDLQEFLLSYDIPTTDLELDSLLLEYAPIRSVISQEDFANKLTPVVRPINYSFPFKNRNRTSPEPPLMRSLNGLRLDSINEVISDQYQSAKLDNETLGSLRALDSFVKIGTECYIDEYAYPSDSHENFIQVGKHNFQKLGSAKH